MAKLAIIDLPDVDDKKAKSSIPSVKIEGDAVTRYNEARDQVDAATEVMNLLKPTLIEAGLQAVFEHNTKHADDSKAILSSVNLTDEEKEVCMFTWTRKDLKNAPKQVETEFNRLRMVDGKKANINDCAAFEVVAKFDTGVFMVNDKFNPQRYEAFVDAMAAVAAEYEVENPLSCAKVLVPKADFHDKRWALFDVEANIVIQSVLPTQVNLKPIRPDAK